MCEFSICGSKGNDRALRQAGNEPQVKSHSVLKIVGVSGVALVGIAVVFGGLTYTCLRPGYLRTIKWTGLADAIQRSPITSRRLALGAFITGCTTFAALSLVTVARIFNRCCCSKQPKTDRDIINEHRGQQDHKPVEPPDGPGSDSEGFEVEKSEGEKPSDKPQWKRATPQKKHNLHHNNHDSDSFIEPSHQPAVVPDLLESSDEVGEKNVGADLEEGKIPPPPPLPGKEKVILVKPAVAPVHQAPVEVPNRKGGLEQAIQKELKSAPQNLEELKGLLQENSTLDEYLDRLIEIEDLHKQRQILDLDRAAIDAHNKWNEHDIGVYLTYLPHMDAAVQTLEKRKEFLVAVKENPTLKWNGAHQKPFQRPSGENQLEACRGLYGALSEKKSALMEEIKPDSKGYHHKDVRAALEQFDKAVAALSQALDSSPYRQEVNGINKQIEYYKARLGVSKEQKKLTLCKLLAPQKDRSNLLDEIRQGIKLKNVNVEEKGPFNPFASFMGKIDQFAKKVSTLANHNSAEHVDELKNKLEFADLESRFITEAIEQYLQEIDEGLIIDAASAEDGSDEEQRAIAAVIRAVVSIKCKRENRPVSASCMVGFKNLGMELSESMMHHNNNNNNNHHVGDPLMDLFNGMPSLEVVDDGEVDPEVLEQLEQSAKQFGF